MTPAINPQNVKNSIEALEKSYDVHGYAQMHREELRWIVEAATAAIEMREYAERVQAELDKERGRVKALESALDVAEKTFDTIENWLGNELFDDDELDHLDCSQETRAENISEMIKRTLSQISSAKAGGG